MPQELPLPLPGTIVRARGRSWRVVDAERHADCGVCRLAEVRPSSCSRRLALIVPFDHLAPVPAPALPMRAGRRHWTWQLGSQLVAVTGDATLRAAAAALFDLLPYQLEPALAVLRGESRLLIADDVGLGKTVQAALILAEIFAREPAARCLVTAPASLCLQWVGELRGRFQLPVALIDRAALQRLASSLPPGSLVWDQQPLSITSFDFAKRPEVLRHLARVRWDALVVDEAHMASLAPERAAAIAVLAARARRLVLLTATPHASDTEGFRALCEIGRLPAEPPVLMFRRSRADLGTACTRRVHVLHVRLTPAEWRMHTALDRYTTEVWREPGNDAGPAPAARLAMIVLRKRAASGPAALLASLSRRLSLLETDGEAAVAHQLLLPLEAGEDRDPADDEPAAVLAAPGLRDRGAERARLAVLVELATRACAADSKLGALARLLRRLREPAIVFTEYRDTLTRLVAHLPLQHVPALLHGGLDQGERQAAIRAFTAGETPVLLATDAAAHGLNLHARCRLVVNAELPWMPSRLEQRAGRVDRIGQRRRVHVVHLLAQGTSEEHVLARLAARVERERATFGRAADPLGSLRNGEMDVAREIFEARRAADCQSISTDGFFRRIDLSSEASAERLRLEAIRQLIHVRGRRGGDRRGERANAQRPCWTVVRRRRCLSRLPLGLVCVFAARIVDGRGSLVEETPIVLHVSLDPAICGRRALELAVPRLLRTVRPALGIAALIEADARVAALRTSADHRLATLAAREGAIGGDPAAQDAPVQPGLFDRRATRQAEEERRHRAADREGAERRLEVLKREGAIGLAGEPELVLVLGVAA